MEKLSLLVVTGLLLVAASYQGFATDSLADTGGTTHRHELELNTRNAAFGAFTEAKHMVEAAETFDPFLGSGIQLDGDYEGAAYTTRITSDGEHVTISSYAFTASETDTVDFSVSAQVSWASGPDIDHGSEEGRYLVLKAYYEE